MIDSAITVGQIASQVFLKVLLLSFGVLGFFYEFLVSRVFLIKGGALSGGHGLPASVGS